MKWSEKVTNEQVLEHIGEKRTLPNNIMCIKVNLIGHILKRNYLLHDAIEGQMTEVKGVGRRKRRTKLFVNLIKKMETTVYRWNISIFHKSRDLLRSSIINNNTRFHTLI